MSSKKQTAPTIRFKGHTDDWEQRTLGELSEIVRGASPRPIQDPKWFDSNSDVGWLRISDVTAQNGRIYYLEQKISKVGQEKTRVLKEPHLLLSIAATVGKPVVNYVNTGVHDGFLIFLNPLFDREYMFQWLEMFRPKWQKYGQPGSQVNLNSELVRNQEIMIPSLKEQIQIGTFFKKLDDTIALHQRQLDNYKELKKTMLQKVFNQELRFKDDYGNDYPEWEIKSFKDVFISIPSKEHQIKSSSYHEKGKYEVVDQGKEDVVGYSDQTEKLFENVPVIIFGDHTTNLKYRDNPFIVGADGVKLLKSTEQAKYSFYVLEKFNVNQEGYKRHYSMLQEINIPIPSRQEQQRIENLLSSIDNKNRKLIYKIALLMELKKSFMQQMFV